MTRVYVDESCINELGEIGVFIALSEKINAPNDRTVLFLFIIIAGADFSIGVFPRDFYVRERKRNE